MRPVWWTCGCGRRQVSRGAGRPECVSCGKLAGFAIDAPSGQEGLGFAPEPASPARTPCRGDEDPDR
jgi:hypothetical protein